MATIYLRSVATLFLTIVALADLSSANKRGPPYKSAVGGDSAHIGNITNANVTSALTLVHRPERIVMTMNMELVLHVNYTLTCNSNQLLYHLEVTTSDPEVLTVPQKTSVTLDCVEAIFDSGKDTGVLEGNFSVTLSSDLLGRSWLQFRAVPHGRSASPLTEAPVQDGGHEESEDVDILVKRMVLVLRARRTIDKIFQITVYIFIIIATIGMGCKTDLRVVREVLKKPIAPVIGFVCQYVGMPLIAFLVAKTVKFETPAMAFGIFACGVCPGGGVSNIYSYLLGGDISLSVTMTTISTIAALGMLPLWMFTLGQYFHDDKMKITIPYVNILTTLALVIFPLFVGFFLKYKLKKVTKIILKVIKPVTLITVLFLLTFGIYTNQYIFRLFKPSAILAGCLLPYIGYVLGGGVALICRQPWYRVKTIAIETGIQNVGVAFLILIFALPPPDGDIAAAGPAASAVMTPLPLFLVTIPYVIYNKCKKKKKKEEEEEEEPGAEAVPTSDENQNGKVELRNGMILAEIEVDNEELEKLSSV